MGVAAGAVEGRKPMQSWRYLEVQKPWIPNCFAIILFHHFVKRDILFFQRVFIIVHQILIFLAKLKQGWDKIA